MCPYCHLEVSSHEKCPMCDEYEADLKDLLEMALPLQMEMEKESAQITDMMVDHKMLLLNHKFGGRSPYGKAALLRQDRELLRTASEIRVRYTMELTDMNRAILELQADSALHFPTVSDVSNSSSEEDQIVN